LARKSGLVISPSNGPNQAPFLGALDIDPPPGGRRENLLRRARDAVALLLFSAKGARPKRDACPLVLPDHGDRELCGGRRTHHVLRVHVAANLPGGDFLPERLARPNLQDSKTRLIRCIAERQRSGQEKPSGRATRGLINNVLLSAACRRDVFQHERRISSDVRRSSCG